MSSNVEALLSSVGSIHRTLNDPENGLVAKVGNLEKNMDPLIEVYDGALFVRKFVIGLAAIVIAVGSIGGGFYMFVHWIRYGS